ncbi:PAS domain S-box protein [Haloarcula sp. S1AR25-5A]|uniref:histidine kinase n=1 Tax=Haloarcula terrestris TaxID=2950533 RepID=A0AAE4JKW1_9EURY|nr:PAS domain S-box protein [Haloarcula terrestris]MDS0223714.1 PAS domain S-box protein [Haloarcula terrestris]
MSQQALTSALQETIALFDSSGTPQTTTEVAEQLDLGRRSAYDRLERLVDHELVETKKVGANGRVWWRPSQEQGTAEATSDRMLSRLVENVPGIVYRCRNDPGWPMLFISDTAEDITGYDPERIEAGAVSWGADIVHPDDREQLRQAIGSQLADSKEFTVEYRIQTAAGDIRWVRERGRIVHRGDTQTDTLEGVITDITEERRSSETVAYSEEQFRSLVEATTEYAIFMLDADGCVQTWNEGARRIKGYQADEIEGKHVSTFYTEADRADDIPKRNLQRAAEEGVTEDEGWRVRADGSRFWAHVTITALYDDGELSGYAKVTRDMTDRRLAEQQLQQEKAFVESLFEAQQDIVYAFDNDGQFIRWNDRLNAVTGYSDPQIRSLHPIEMVADGAVPEAIDAFERVLEHGETVTVELPIESANGGRVPYEFTAGPLAEAGTVVGVTGIGRDISERKRNEREIERQRDELQEELAEVFERIDDAFFALDKDWRFTHVNDRATNLLDRSVGELIGQRVWDEFPEATSTIFKEKYEHALATQEPVTFEDYYAPLDTWFEVTAYPSESGLSVYFRDVTERKAREHELERYETILETVNDGIYVIDEDGMFTAVNEAYESMVGQSAEQLLGSHVSSVITNETILETAQRIEDELANDERTTASLEAELTNDTGETRIGEATFALMETETGYERVGVVRDVTERKAREQELLQQRMQLAALNHLNQVVHDITDAVIEQSTRDEIETVVCKRLAAVDSYQFAWIGEADAASQTVYTRSETGVEGYLDDMTISVDPDDPRSDGPTGRAFRTGEIQTTQDISEDDSYEPWRGTVSEYDVRSSAAIPIVYDESLYGVLNVYADRPDAFEGREQAVIQQLGEVIGHAIAATERKQALMSDEVVELEFSIPDVFEALDIECETEGTISLAHASPLSDGEYIVYGSASDDATDTVRAITDTLPHWEEVTFRDDDNPVHFEVRLSEPPVISAVASVGGAIERAVVTDGDYEMTIYVSPNADVRKVISAVENAYPASQMLKRHQISRSNSEARNGHHILADLTQRQRTLLESAYYAGFFEVPRHVSGKEIAESFEISSPTFHQHLRKAEKHILEQLLSSPSAISE